MFGLWRVIIDVLIENEYRIEMSDIDRIQIGRRICT
jgi:hypothetical protein